MDRIIQRPTYEYIHEVGDHLNKVFDFNADGVSSTETILQDFHENRLSSKILYYDVILSFLMNHKSAILFGDDVEHAKATLDLLNIPKTGYIGDMVKKLDMTKNPTDVVTYFNLMNNDNMLFESLDVTKTHFGEKQFFFVNPSQTKSFYFSKSDTPANSHSFGGNYAIDLYESIVNTSKSTKLVNTYHSNHEVYQHILDYDLVFNN